MTTKTTQLQIRVTPAQKAALKRLARAAGRDVSGYVLSRLLPEPATTFAEMMNALATGQEPRYALAALNDFLHACPSSAFPDAVAIADLRGLTPFLSNYVAAMVEQAADAKHVAPPGWVGDIPSLASPVFVTPLASLRLHLLQTSPVPFKRRGIFVDASVGARV